MSDKKDTTTIYPETRQFIGKVTDSKILARTEVRFGLPRSNPSVEPIQTVKPTITDPAPGLPITSTHLDIWELQHRKV